MEEMLRAGTPRREPFAVCWRGPNAAIKGKAAAADASGIGLCLIGIFAGLGIGASAIFQGRTAGAAADAYAETGKGFSNYIAAIGVIETVAIFVMVFAYHAN